MTSESKKKFWTLPRVILYVFFFSFFVTPQIAIEFFGGYPLGVQRLYNILLSAFPYVTVAVVAVTATLAALILLFGKEKKK
jgi:hypothetical protein